MPLTREQLAAMIPHEGAMCLLDGVSEWDATRIRCFSRSHRDPANPLRCAGRLPALCAVEYAAQAMATHGALCGSVAARPRAGYLASLRDVACRRAWLDDVTDDLVIEAARLLSDEAHVVYEFSVKAGGIEIVRGRAAVSLDAQRRAT
jgi:predicted hotdog family 3-hydroxylacyl-ACP dehydratase